MTNQLQVFRKREFGEIQIIEENGRFEFEATVSAKILGYVNPYKAIGDHCKKDGVTKREVIDRLGRKQEKNFISEGNLYRLITHSKLPNAEKFEKWVFDEVLPSIRQTGAYIANQTQQNEPLSQATLFIKQELQKLNIKYDKLEKEYKKLLKNNSTNSKQLTLQCVMPQLNNSIYSWINTCQINLNLVLSLPTTYLYDHYNEYCKKQNLFQMGKKIFYKELKQIFNLHYRTYQKTDGKRYFKIG